MPYARSNEISKSQLPQRERGTLHHWFFRTEPRDTNLFVDCNHNSVLSNAFYSHIFLILFLLNLWFSCSLDNAIAHFTDIISATSSHPISEGRWKAFWEIINQKGRSLHCVPIQFYTHTIIYCMHQYIAWFGQLAEWERNDCIVKWAECVSVGDRLGKQHKMSFKLNTICCWSMTFRTYKCFLVRCCYRQDKIMSDVEFWLALGRERQFG